MIQRIQSLFLLIAVICVGLLYKFPFATSDISSGQFLADQSYDLLDSNFYWIFAGLSFILFLATLFSFKNRKLQIRLATFSIISNILFLLLIIFLFYQEFMGVQSSAVVNDGFGVYLPIISLIMVILANRFIKKDDKLVKSMDRLR